MNNKLFNFSGYALTPPALYINVSEWLGQLTMNQAFTFVISSAVVVFWYFKIKEQKFRAKQAERQYEGKI